MDAVVSVPGAEPWSARGSGDRAGVGVAVVHGFTANPLGTRPLGQRLAAEGYTVEVPLLPGHGTSHRDLAQTRYDDWFEAVERTVDHLRNGCDTIVVIGHSTGGSLVLDLAGRRPDDVDGVAVLNPVILDRTDPLAKFAPFLRHVFPYLPRDLVAMPTNDVARPGAEEAAYKLVPLKTGYSLMSQFPRIRSQLPRITQPLFVAWSPDDHTVPADNARELMGMVGSEDITELVCDRSYHVVLMDYDAPKVEAALVAFVARVAGR